MCTIEPSQKAKSILLTIIAVCSLVALSAFSTAESPLFKNPQGQNDILPQIERRSSYGIPTSRLVGTSSGVAYYLVKSENTKNGTCILEYQAAVPNSWGVACSTGKYVTASTPDLGDARYYPEDIATADVPAGWERLASNVIIRVN